MPGSNVEDLFMDDDLVVVQAWSHVDDQQQRRTFIFSRRTLSYMNAFASFIEPSYGPSILIFNEWNKNIYLIHEYRSLNIKLNLPYLTVHPVESTKAGDK